jgi:hypothetical protein
MKLMGRRMTFEKKSIKAKWEPRKGERIKGYLSHAIYVLSLNKESKLCLSLHINCRWWNAR